MLFIQHGLVPALPYDTCTYTQTQGRSYSFYERNELYGLLHSTIFQTQ